MTACSENNITIVSCTKHDTESFQTTTLYKSVERLEMTDDLHVFYQNSRGLGECYNEFIETHTGSQAVFVHDDVAIIDTYFVDKLVDYWKRYPVLGVAGSTDLSLNRLPLTWINSPRESWSGGIYHSSVDNGGDVLSVQYNHYGKFDRKCVTVDGVFIAVDIPRIGSTRFQPEFKFDFYDMSFCIECYRNSVAIGTVPIAMCHLSHGSGILRPEYNEVQDSFLKKYKQK